MDKSKAIITSVEDAIDAADKAIRGLISATNDPNIKAGYELLRALNPGWCRWLKEHGLGDSHRIVYASTSALTNLMAEVVANVSTTETQSMLAEALGEKLKQDLVRQVGLIGTASDIVLPGFRRLDS